jgi:hypothetical protein
VSPYKTQTSAITDHEKAHNASNNEKMLLTDFLGFIMKGTQQSRITD